MSAELDKLGLYLKNKRTNAEYSQNDVAEILGYKTAQFISNIERGISSPPMKTIKVFIDLYKIPKQEIFDLLLDIRISELQIEIFGKKSGRRASSLRMAK